MMESFAWSYKRKYKIGYIWQGLTDNDLIIPTSYHEYLLKGSLLSPIKIFENLKKEAKYLATPVNLRTPDESLQREKTTSSKPPIELEEQSPVNIEFKLRRSPKENYGFNMYSWKEEMKRVEKVCCEEFVPMEN
ncbi:hypothetical protein MA16_Dca006235 [Dendrobium catenatum]|uniref:SOSEKI DIX-like domain-containing protein n=1 Tax=Dendrobium catenatum TaxID=906689 RepID=A0A2I0W997_9ASPA|nr:hypothetical protein MA16_Dca006235 [Dendrobium catenatum]